MDFLNLLVLNFVFLCGLCGFYVYKDLWVLKLNEKFEIIYEENNLYDCYVVVVIRKIVSWFRLVVVGYLLWEILRFIRFIILYGVIVKVKVSDMKY